MWSFIVRHCNNSAHEIFSIGLKTVLNWSAFNNELRVYWIISIGFMTILLIISDEWWSSCIRTHSLTSYEDFLSLLAIANKYEINSLNEASVQHLYKKITVDNGVDICYSTLLYDTSPLLFNDKMFISCSMIMIASYLSAWSWGVSM
jgi:hypothetical protein